MPGEAVCAVMHLPVEVYKIYMDHSGINLTEQYKLSSVMDALKVLVDA